MQLLPDESPDLREEARKIWGDDAEQWLRTPNDLLGGRTPADLAGTPDETHVRNVIRSIRYTGVS